jgi:GTP-binding protein
MQTFVDYVKIYFRSGNGGPGVVAWRREKFIRQGGPWGGNGGRGGHIILQADPQLWTLLDLKYRKFIHADNGDPGANKLCQGKDAEDIILKVPLGTIAKDPETGEVMAELTTAGQKVVLLPGGRGGMGNAFFKSATRQAPDFAQPGEPGIEKAVILELKILADVGLVGFPNAGKSTLLSVVTAARPAIADYPFTTLTPNLGIVQYRDYRSFVMADIPGIIEGAATGKGLGTQFLRHIERNAVLLFVLPADVENLRGVLKILLAELKKYNPLLLDKDRVIVVSKSDLVDEIQKEEIKRSLKGHFPVFISAVTGEGLQQLKDRLWKKLEHSKEVLLP